MSEALQTATVQVAEQKEADRAGWLNHRRLALLVVALAALVYAQFGLFRNPVRGDRANWDYMSQVIARGGMPYRDAANIKAPLSAYIGAGAIIVGRPFGLRDIFAIRVVYYLLAVLTAGLTFIVAYEYFGSRRCGLLAALIFMAFNSFATANSAGVQPKTPMIMFGLASLWALKQDRPVWSGVFGMLSALSWQPGLLFAGAAGLGFSRYLTSWRDLKAVKLIAGACLPLAALLAYFWAAGALKDFYLWAFHFNFSVYGPEEFRSSEHFFLYLKKMLQSQYRDERLLCYIAVIGIALAVLQEIKLARERGARIILERAPNHAIIISPAVYFAFCMINVQGSADFLPFLPFIGAFAALAIVTAIDRATEMFEYSLKRRLRPVAGIAAFAIICLVIFFTNVFDAFTFRKKGLKLNDQQAQVQEIVSHLEPTDKIYVHGATEILVLSGLHNASPHFMLDRGKDTYLDQIEPGGFYGWLERLKSERPKVVALTRLRKVKRKKALNAWVAADYIEQKGRALTYYLRKD
jgi:hypothetical protein